MSAPDQHSDLRELVLDYLRTDDYPDGWITPDEISDQAAPDLLLARGLWRTLEQLEAAQAGGVGLIAAERQRQVEVEGWTPDHDDEHDDGQMARAAARYAMGQDERDHYGYAWPWDWKWWKPTPRNRVRELVKAGALIAAEIDRLQRAAPIPAKRSA